MRLVAFDIETTDLKALMGRILCASFYEIGSDAEPYTFRADTAPWKSKDPIDDSKLCVALRDELEKYNAVITWNGKMFDVPFLNARLARAGERLYKPQFHIDAMYYARGTSLRIGSSRLVNVQKFFDLGESKTEISWEQWQRAAGGNRAAMDEVVVHCEQDVKVLAQAYWRLLPQIANVHR